MSIGPRLLSILYKHGYWHQYCDGDTYIAVNVTYTQESAVMATMRHCNYLALPHSTPILWGIGRSTCER